MIPTKNNNFQVYFTRIKQCVTVFREGKGENPRKFKCTKDSLRPFTAWERVETDKGYCAGNYFTFFSAN